MTVLDHKFRVLHGPKFVALAQLVPDTSGCDPTWERKAEPGPKTRSPTHREANLAEKNGPASSLHYATWVQKNPLL